MRVSRALTDAVPPRAMPEAPRLQPALDWPMARRVLGDAMLLGVAADALLRTGITGLALPLFVAILAATLLSLTLRAGRRTTRETMGWLITAVVLAATVAWRDADLLQVAGVLGTIGALLMAAVATHQQGVALLAPRVRDLLLAALGRARVVAAGLLPLVAREVATPDDVASAGTRTRPALRAAIIAIPLVMLFGALLRGADPIFASLVSLPDLEVGTLLSHLLLAGVFAWLAGGWARAALDRREPANATPTVPFTLGTLEITTALGALNALFALYVLAQLGWFFGGERFLHDRTGLTAAEYARQGFFQVVLVVLLVVPLLLATRAMLAPVRGLARRHTMLSLPLILLLGAIILSAASRMRLYVHYFGLTTDRFYPMAFMAWLSVVLAWLAWTVLRGRGERFVAGALGSGLVALLLLDVAAPDVLVARVNIARSAHSMDAAHRLDLAYLARLSGDAVPLAVAAVLAPAPSAAAADTGRCSAAVRLFARWGPASRAAAQHGEAGAWRQWNGGDARALEAVARHSPALRTVQHEACRGTNSGRTSHPAVAP